MKKVVFLLSMVFLLNACSHDDVDDLRQKYEDLKKEQERQAELLATYQTLMQAVENKLTISAIENTSDGYKIVFSNGTELLIKSGQDTSAVTRIEDTGNAIVFYMSNGTTITIGKTEMIGLYILSEGTMGGGNGQLVYFDYNKATDKYERDEAKRFPNYGETPNDLIIYGSKMYCAISGSSTGGGLVRVINPFDGETIRNISITKESVTLQPRRLAAHGGKVYVTLYSGNVAQIDTASYTTDVAPLSGTYSEGLCISGQSLYICNSGQGNGNTVSVVDMATFTETETITVPYNPMNILNAGNNELYVNTATVWSGPASGPANLHVLNTITKQITHTFNLGVESIAAGKNYIYGTAFDWVDYKGLLKKISIADKSVSDFTTSEDELMFAYKLSVNPITDEVFLTQQMGQDINRFREDGVHVETLKAGQQNGAAVVFVNMVK
ncbi:MAG: hypothetical protein LBC48_07305 [Dysgonamonadaceae bacterium]|jgi:YVTN family beta-propeller protein|nr:hypothetical protein [Dysgonamonadaceae bacterium]